MPRLGDLERSIMEVLWNASTPLTAKAIGQALEGRADVERAAFEHAAVEHAAVERAAAERADRALAVTTVLTVLSRLEKKGMLTRSRDDRAHTYAPSATREDHVAELMREALGTAGDRDAALARFVGAASPAEADVLRRALRSLGRGGR